MLKFETLNELTPNKEILNIIKDFSYSVKNDKIKHLMGTNLKFIEPIEYHITSPTILTIFEYKVNEISNKPFYIQEYKEKYSLREIKEILKNSKKM